MTFQGQSRSAIIFPPRAQVEVGVESTRCSQAVGRTGQYPPGSTPTALRHWSCSDLSCLPAACLGVRRDQEARHQQPVQGVEVPKTSWLASCLVGWIFCLPGLTVRSTESVWCSSQGTARAFILDPNRDMCPKLFTIHANPDFLFLFLIWKMGLPVLKYIN